MTRQQRGVALGAASGAALAAAILLAPAAWFSRPWPHDLATRIGFALRADAVIMVWLAAAIVNVARLRFVSAADIDGSGLTASSPRISPSVAVLQNTLEQAVLAAVLYLALACLPGPDGVAFIPKLLLLFCIGRGAFWIGYRFGAAGRAFGFAATFYPTVFGYGVVMLSLAGAL